MATAWKRVYVFVSSTFNDMHAERDYLVKRVFPQLRDWCEQRKLRLVDIDLRWGVTEDDATRHRNVVKTCLTRIDQCRPFFVCFLGQRRGWIPERNDIADETFSAYPELDAEVGKASITEMEILHALIRPLHGDAPQDSDHPEYYEPAEHAYFYLRHPSYLGQLSTQPKMVRDTYTNDWIEDPALRAEADRELAHWRDEVIPQTGRHPRQYEALWSPTDHSPELAMPLHCPSSDEKNVERWRHQWARAGVHVAGDDVNADPVEAEKACRFNTQLTTGRLTNFTCADKTLSDTILVDLQAGIMARYPEHTEDIDANPLQRELDQQEEFLSINSEGFIEREGAFAGLDAYIDSGSRELFVLTAEGGMGKSMLIANWIDRLRDLDADAPAVIYRFIGQSDGSSSVPNLLRSLLLELQEVHERIPRTIHETRTGGDGEERTEEVPLEIPLDPTEIQNYWQTNLSGFGKQGKIVFVIDAVNQLETGLKNLNWLPLNGLPENVKLIASFRRGAEGSQELLDRWANMPNVRPTEVKPFEDLDDRRALVKQYLDQYLKELDEKHIDALINSEGARNPLFLKVVLSELRVFGAFAQLGEKIRSDFGTTPVSAFQAVLRRLESDPVHTAIDPQQAVPLLFGLLAHARRGLQLDELAGLFAMQLNDPPNEDLIRDGLYLFLRQVDPFLARRDNRYDFFYESFKTAVIERYTREPSNERPMARTKKQWHGALVDYFEKQPYFLETSATSRSATDTNPANARQANVRRVDELPWQMVAVVQQHDSTTDATAAEHDWARLETLLTDLHFIEAKSAAGLVFEMQDDYGSALAALPEAQAQLEEQQRRKARAARWTEEITDYSRRCNAGEQPPLPEIIQAVEPWSTERIEAECERIIGNPTRLDRLKASAAFVRSECYQLLKYATYEGFVLQHVYNSAPEGPMHEIAQLEIEDSKPPVVLRIWPRDARNNPKPALQTTLEGHAGPVNDVSLTSDGMFAVSVSDDQTLRIWNLETGQCIRKLEGHSGSVNGVSMTPDGTRAVSASQDKTVRVWDLDAGQCLRTLEGHTDSVNGVSVTPDGARAVSASRDKTLRVWDIQTGQCLQALEGHYNEVNDVSMTPDGMRAVSTSRKTLMVWDLETGQCVQTLKGHSGSTYRDSVYGVSVTPDGTRAVSASKDDNLRVWDLETGRRLRTLKGHYGPINDVSVTPDGMCAVSGSSDHTLRVWDLETGQCRRTLEGHTDSVNGVSVTPDGTRSVSGSSDKTLRVWDLETGRSLRTLEAHLSGVSDLKVSRDRTRAVSASDDHTLRVWDLETGCSLQTLKGHIDPVRGVSVTPDGTRAMSTSRDKTLRVWDLKSGRCLWKIKHNNDNFIKIINQKRAVSAGADEWDFSGTTRRLRVWDLAKGQCILTIKEHINVLDGVSVTPDATRAVSASKDHTLRVWDLETGQCLQAIEESTSSFDIASMTPDAMRAVSASKDYTLRVWDLKTGHCLRTLAGHTNSVNGVSVAPDGTRAVSGSSDHTLRVWDLKTGRCLQTLEGHYNAVNNVSMTPDGMRAVSKSRKTLMVWDLETGRCLQAIEGHRRERFSPDGKLMVSTSEDNTLWVWDLEMGQVVAAISIGARVRAVAISSNGTGRGSFGRTSTICLGLTTGEVIFLDASRVIPP